jgi:hypothetical protein
MMTKTIRSFSLALIPGVLLFATSAWAAECREDADCEEGSECQKAVSVEPCDPNGGDCNSTPVESDTGTCVKLPVVCESDADCSEYLVCQWGPTQGVCWSNEDGETQCEDIAPAEKYCSVGPKTCEVDSDCPTNFECITTDGCSTRPECDGPDCECLAETSKFCEPKKVECETDAACPTDWRCVQNTITTCSGGGSSGMGGSTGVDMGTDDIAPSPLPPEPADEPMDGSSDSPPTDIGDDSDGASDGSSDGLVDPMRPDDRPEDNCTVEPAMGYCMPAEWVDYGTEYPTYGGVEDGGAEPGVPGDDKGDSGSENGDDGGVSEPGGDDGTAPPRGEEGEMGNDDVVKKGGCVASPSAPTRTAWGLVGLFLLAPLLRRRAASSRAVASS